MSKIRFANTLSAIFAIGTIATTAAAEDVAVAIEPTLRPTTVEAAPEQAPPSDSARPGYHEHDGFYLRMQPGVGYTSFGANGVTVDGVSGMFTLSLGAAVTENLIVFAHLGASSITSPQVSSGGSSATFDGSASLAGYGAGLAYYLMPANVYGSVALLASTLSLADKNGNKLGESDTGFGVDLAVGKEWWVSDNWGLGVAGRFMYASIKDTTAISPGIVFSATYN